jgi:hypothetical protein
MKIITILIIIAVFLLGFFKGAEIISYISDWIWGFLGR